MTVTPCTCSTGVCKRTGHGHMLLNCGGVATCGYCQRAERLRLPSRVDFREDPPSAMEVVGEWSRLLRLGGRVPLLRVEWSNLDAGTVELVEGYLQPVLAGDDTIHLRCSGLRAWSAPVSILRTVELVKDER